MLNIFNNLKPFFEECYRRYSVREYSRLLKISPPTASKILKEFNKEGLLKIVKENNYLYFWANKDNKIFVNMSKIYWVYRLEDFLDYANKTLINPTIILFGSLSKAEAKLDSDLDITIFADDKKKIDIQKFENKLKRKIQLFIFNAPEDVKNKELLNNILNGFILCGKIRWT